MSTLLTTAALVWVGFAIVCASAELYERRRESKALRIVRLAAWRVGLQAKTADIETRHHETVTRAVQLGLLDGIDIAHALGGKTQLDAAAWWALTSGEEQ